LLLVREDEIVARADSRSALIAKAVEEGVDSNSYDIYRLVDTVSIPAEPDLDVEDDAEFAARYAREKAKT